MGPAPEAEGDTQTVTAPRSDAAPAVTRAARGRRFGASTRGRRRGRRTSPWLLIAAGWTVLTFTWSLSNPPFHSPDEWAHYIRAVAVGGGELGGTPTVRIPPGLWGTLPTPHCNAFRSDLSAACVEGFRATSSDTVIPTPAGSYAPTAYLLPGAALRGADDPLTANLVARVVAATTCLAFLLLALVFLSRGANGFGLLVAGPLVAVTPMALFVSSTLNPNGLEIAAGVAFIAGLLSLTRSSDRPRWLWVATAISGIALAAARPLGAVWVVVDVFLVLALVWHRELWEAARRRWRLLAVPAALLLAAVLASRIWEASEGSPVTQRGVVDLEALKPWFANAVYVLGRAVDEEIGVFGALDTSMPPIAYPVWQGLIAAFVGIAFLVGRPRERVVLAAFAVIPLAVAVYLSMSLMSSSGGIGDVQGRYVLPLAVALPLLAGEILFRHRAALAPLRPGAYVIATAVIAAAIHLLALWINARRHGIGTDGSHFFFLHAEWTPLLGYAVWAVAAVAGSGLLVLAAVRAARAPA